MSTIAKNRMVFGLFWSVWSALNLVPTWPGWRFCSYVATTVKRIIPQRPGKIAHKPIEELNCYTRTYRMSSMFFSVFENECFFMADNDSNVENKNQLDLWLTILCQSLLDVIGSSSFKAKKKRRPTWQLQMSCEVNESVTLHDIRKGKSTYPKVQLLRQ